MSRPAAVNCLEEHPNLDEIVGVLAQLPDISDVQMRRLAAGWRNSEESACARDRALSFDSPLVVEVLAALDALGALYADDLCGDAAYVTLDPELTQRGLCAVRDAIAAAYAQPVLTRGQHDALMNPWRTVFPRPGTGPELGPVQLQVKALLDAFGGLAARCHDGRRARDWEVVGLAGLVGDMAARERAAAAAWQAALDSGRRRLWTLVRRSAAEALSRGCPTCRRRPDPLDPELLDLAMDAACALLVADVLDPDEVAVLTAAVAHLLPAQSRGVES